MTINLICQLCNKEHLVLTELNTLLVCEDCKAKAIEGSEILTKAFLDQVIPENFRVDEKNQA